MDRAAADWLDAQGRYSSRLQEEGSLAQPETWQVALVSKLSVHIPSFSRTGALLQLNAAENALQLSISALGPIGTPLKHDEQSAEKSLDGLSLLPHPAREPEASRRIAKIELEV